MTTPCVLTPVESKFPILDTLRHSLVCVFLLGFAVRGNLLEAQTAAAISHVPLPVSGFAAVVASEGNTYFGGTSGPTTSSAPQPQGGGGVCFINAFPIGSVPAPCTDAYVGAVDSTGNLLFGTFLGGATADQATALAVDSAGNVFLTGSTGGSFPTTPEAAIPTSAKARVFAAKLKQDGTLVQYSTYLPDTALTASAIAVDSAGAAYIAGTTSTSHAYVAKVSPDGSSIAFYSILAGNQSEEARALLVAADGSVLVVGSTTSSDFPVSRGVLQDRIAGTANLFVARLDGRGNLLRATYLGGEGIDTPAVVRTDSTENLYIGGSTGSFHFPTTAGAFQPTPLIPSWSQGAPFGFVAKISPDFSTLFYSTYVTTSDQQFPGVRVLAVSPAGEAYFAANTGAGFPVTESAPQACFEGPLSVVVGHLDPGGALMDATYVGRRADFPAGLALGADGVVRLAWTSLSPPTSTLSRIQFGGAGWRAPACLSNSVLNSATLYGDDQGIAPGELITLTGLGIGPEVGLAYQPDDQGMAPRELAGVKVLFDGEPAPVLYAQSRQVNAQAPFELRGKTVTTISLVRNGVVIGALTAPANKGRPGLFRLSAGISSQAVALNENGTLNSADNPAKAGTVIAVWGTGFPPIESACATGRLNPSTPVVLADGWKVDFGPESVLYAGSAPGLLCGIVQINLVVPASAPRTDRLLPQFNNPSLGRAGAIAAVGATVNVK